MIAWLSEAIRSIQRIDLVLEYSLFFSLDVMNHAA